MFSQTAWELSLNFKLILQNLSLVIFPVEIWHAVHVKFVLCKFSTHAPILIFLVIYWQL